ncbi:hypothetical protein VMCG_10055 [Cytospora schulzeri]|uniref:Nephrocystin 3-like N-terminal domain-containing protein n=1 Tax=Cytospora schulzeri TaxID=448051 RepID=A0A423VCQ4_9PEZI|nr:hypothetical protein VMCG_10055 [Valsa malicola]
MSESQSEQDERAGLRDTTSDRLTVTMSNAGAPLDLETRDHVFREGDSHAGLKLERILEPSSGTDTDKNEHPGVDFVHVMGARRDQERLPILQNTAPKAAKRELISESDMPSLLNDDVAFTLSSVDCAARQLLAGLKHFQQICLQTSRRAIVFVAYDLGALVLKKVFSGCFHRDGENKELGVKMLDFLQEAKSDTAWEKYYTRIALISDHIRQVFDSFHGTLGIPTELAVREENMESADEAFPHLFGNIFVVAVDERLPSPSEAAIQLTLMSLIRQHVQMITKVQSRDGPVFSSDAYENWLYGNGTEILYLQGPDSQANTEAGEQICLEWVREHQTIGYFHPRLFEFLCSSRDPSRNLSGMLASTILHMMATNHNSSKTTYSILEDHCKLQHAWLEEDLIKLVYFSGTRLHSLIPFLLLELDECGVRSRKAFWESLDATASRLEVHLKLIVTSRKPGALREELKAWPDIHVHEYTLPPPAELEDVQTDEYVGRLISRLCPKRLGEAMMRRTLKRLDVMDRKRLEMDLSLIEQYSRWPAEMYSDNLNIFSSLVEGISPSSTPNETLCKILLSIPDQSCLRWSLSWISSGKRPLSMLELSMMRYYHSRGFTQVASLPEDYEVELCSKEITSQLRGLLYLHENHLYISPDILDLMDGDIDSIGSELKESAPRTTAQFLLEYLGSSKMQERLNGLYCQYVARFESSGDDITPPIVPDRRDAIFYAVEALPYHLSRIEIPDEVRNKMKEPSGPYLPWSKVYWAMCNPFSRAVKGPLKSAWATWEAAPESGFTNMVRLCQVNEDDEEASQNATGSSRPAAQLPEIGRLIDAVRTNNEDLALYLFDQLTPNLEDRQHSGKTESDEPRQITWLSSILWRATWLDMPLLVERLLKNGLPPDDQSSAFNPSPLYMAARLGHSEIVDMLISHGADISVKRANTFTPLCTAAAYGHADIVRALIEQDRAQLNTPQPVRPLLAASQWGAWKVLEVLLELQADTSLYRSATPSGDRGLAPIIASSIRGHVKTTQVLLENNTDPNTAGPSGSGTPLVYAAMSGGGVECVRLLLEHGADPNHELLRPPLLIVIIWTDLVPVKTKIAIFNLLIDNDPPIQCEKADTYGFTPLMHAAWKGDIASVRWLLDHGAKVNAVDKENRHALFHAVKNGQRSVVYELLSHQEVPRLDIIGGNGTLLGTAIGDASLVRTLLDAGANPSFENNKQQTALNIAVVEEKIDTVRLLLEPGRNVDIHHRDDLGWSPILDATGVAPNAEIVRILMENGANIADTEPDGSSPLHLAAHELRPDIVRILLEYHVPEDLERRTTHGQTPLLVTRNYKGPLTLECIRVLVRAGSDINAQDSDGESILIRYALSKSKASAVGDFLLSLPKININILSKVFGTALHLSCEYGNVDLVNKLLERNNIDVDVWYSDIRSTPLIAACMPSGSELQDVEATLTRAERIVRDLVAHGANVDATAGPSIFNALCAASLCAGVGTVNYLLDKSALLRRPDPLGRLPIHFAAVNGIRNFEAVALVHGHDIMAKDMFDKNVLHWASQFGHVETVKSILQRVPLKDRKAWANSPDVDGWTPLAWATRPTSICDAIYWTMSEPQDYAATIQCLTGYGADISAQFRIGQGEEAEVFTPLEMAKLCAAEDEVIRLLTPKEADTINTKEGESAGHDLRQGRKYRKWRGTCDICFSNIYGIVYKCQDCSDYLGYTVCNKCYGRIELVHRRITADEKPHEFIVLEGHDTEFDDPTPIPPRPSPAASRQSPAVGDGADVDDEETQGPDDVDFDEDELDMLDFPASDDLEGLTGP